MNSSNDERVSRLIGDDRFDRGVSPIDVMRAWPDGCALAMLYSGDADPTWGRWSILAEPLGWINRPEAINAPRVLAPEVAHVPFAGGWIGAIPYEVGGQFEPDAASRHHAAHAPTATFAWCDAALLYDHIADEWWRVGHPQALDDLNFDAVAPPAVGTQLVPNTSDHHHLTAVERAIEYIAAGDIFQANITRSYDTGFRGNPRHLAAVAFETARPRYGAYLEPTPSTQVVSLSPELFLQADSHTRRVVTRPVKGTRPASCDPAELLNSAKDAAELHMIVHLMRNDLGRVCEFGSVTVDIPRVIESHATVHHGVAQVSGTLRRDVTMLDLLAATFPAGSITGAPKIRAMQIINELETRARGWYCGSIGFVDICGRATLNVAIRTMTLANGLLTYGAGGGIVADSDPADELAECDQKVEVLRQTLRALSDRASDTSIVETLPTEA